PIRPVKVTTRPGGSVVADFGRVVAAVPTVAFRAGVPGRVVAMRAGYLLDQGPPVPGQVSSTQGTQHTDMSYAYVERLGAQTFHPFDYLGFRYFEIDNAGEPIDAAH